MAPSSRAMSKRVILSYVFDWICVIIIAAIGGSLSYLPPTRRPFSLLDLRISFPYIPSEVSTTALVLISLIAPGILIALVSLAFLPYPSVSVAQWREPRYWRRKLWEWNVGWLGLGLSYACALLLTQMVKSLGGKMRPDFLARCMPDLSQVERYTVGGAGMDISQRWGLVSYEICTQTDASVIKDGFSSFFSGHTSSSFAGLVYLSLWLGGKAGLTLPGGGSGRAGRRRGKGGLGGEGQDAAEGQPKTDEKDGGAGPPVWGFIVFFIPIVVAIYIAMTRWRDYKHDGYDLSAGALVGTFTAVLGYRNYHAGLLTGRSWTWAPRSKEDAFGADLRPDKRSDDIEAGDLAGAKGKTVVENGEASHAQHSV